MTRALVITSMRNPLLKEIRKAASRSTLTPDGHCVAETFHLLEEALRSGCEIPQVIVADHVRSVVEKRIGRLAGVRLHAMPSALFDEVASTESSQGVMALVRPPAWTMDHLFRGRSLVVVLDGVQDPGNAGTIVRSAEAFGATGVLFLKGSVSPFNTKTLRASAGSLFRLPFLYGVDADVAMAAIEQRQVDVYATTPHGGRFINDADLTRRCAIVIGSEGRGVGDIWQAKAMGLKIPTGGVESLNASVAASVTLYEASRQRRGAGVRQ